MVIAKPYSCEGKNSKHLQSKGYSPSDTGPAAKLSLAYLFFFPPPVPFLSRPLRSPPQHLLPRVCAHTGLSGGSTPSQGILSSSTFSKMVPPLPSLRAGTKTNRLGQCKDLLPSTQAYQSPKYSRFLRGQMAFAAEPLLWVTHFLLSPGTANGSL